MKYLVIALAILGLTLGVSILCTSQLHRCTAQAANMLERSLAACEKEEFERAYAWARNAAAQWKSCNGLLCVMLDHTETDEIEYSLRELLRSAAMDDHEDFQLLCAQTAAMMRHVSEMELPYYYNILSAPAGF